MDRGKREAMLHRIQQLIHEKVMYAPLMEPSILAGYGLPDHPERGGFPRASLGPEIEQYLATDTTNAHDRVKLFRLAWDVAGSAFGSRQVLYERFFASDPLTRARIFGAMYPKEEAMDRVREFLRRDDESV